MVSPIHRLIRFIAFAYACYTSYRTWCPPASLTGKPEANGHEPNKKLDDGGWRKRGYPTESDISPAGFRILYALGMSGMTATDLGILWYFSGGLWSFLGQDWSISDLISLAVMHLALRLRERSFKALGEFFTFKVTTTKDQQLITTGPYARLMHPSYTGLIFQRTALVYWLGLKHSLLVFVLYTIAGIPGIAGRMYHEEAELSKHFGKETFDAYKKDRWRLIPYVL